MKIMTEEKLRMLEIRKLVDTIYDPRHEKEVTTLAIAAEVTTPELASISMAAGRAAKKVLLGALLESTMDAKTAHGLRKALPHLIALAGVFQAPGFKDRWDKYQESMQKALQQGLEELEGGSPA